MAEATKSNVAVLEVPTIEPAVGMGEKRNKRGRKPASEKANGFAKPRYFLLAKSAGQDSGKLALGEEFFFRGLLQQWMGAWLGNQWLGLAAASLVLVPSRLDLCVDRLRCLFFISSRSIRR